MFSLEDRVVLVTGGGGLLGRQHGLAISRAGGTVILADLHEDAAANASRFVEESGAPGRAVFCQLDVTSEASLAHAADWIKEEFGHLDGLVNNAANNPTMDGTEDPAAGRLENFSLEAWDADLRVGLTGAFLCAKHFAPLMRKGAAIVNISSDLGLVGPDQRLYQKPGLSPAQQPVKPVSYPAVKAGLIGLTRYLATYWSDGHVRCNAVCPGGVENGQPEELQSRIRDRIPMGRMAQPDEYHGVIVFLLSPASAYLNGAVIAADGGRTAW